ncbi:transmembrane protein 87B-like [Tachyglossus aculeatus]|uniref:transmembrane protein 87B-like n=1 Tax=Tachyglossus aculeatus TaxID=9261 RepID=UPI0018F433F6|nr:transmembrane protein 87B-like [Tachyglossus aculeatus]
MAGRRRLLIPLPVVAGAVPEPGRWDANVGYGSKPLIFRKTVFNSTEIKLKINSFSCPDPVSFTVEWFLKYHACRNEFIHLGDMLEKNTITGDKDFCADDLQGKHCIKQKNENLKCDSELQIFPMLHISSNHAKGQQANTFTKNQEMDRNTQWIFRWTDAKNYASVLNCALERGKMRSYIHKLF